MLPISTNPTEKLTAFLIGTIGFQDAQRSASPARAAFARVGVDAGVSRPLGRCGSPLNDIPLSDCRWNEFRTKDFRHSAYGPPSRAMTRRQELETELL